MTRWTQRRRPRTPIVCSIGWPPGGRLSSEGLADAPCVALTRPVQEYLKKAGGMAGEYRAMVIAAFNRDNQPVPDIRPGPARPTITLMA